MTRRDSYFGVASRYPLFSLIIFLVLLLLQPHFAFAQNKTNPKDNGPIKSKENLKWKQNCSSEQAKSIDDAFENVKAMLAAVQDPDWGSYAAVEYLGTNYIDTWDTYEPKVKEMFKKAYEWVTRSYWFSGPWILCLEPGDHRCNTPYKTDKVFMFYEDTNDDYAEDDQLHISICTSWFSKPSLKVLISQAEYCRKTEKDPARQKFPWDIRFYESRELWLLHAIFHVREVYFRLPTQIVDPGANIHSKYLLVPPPFHDYVRVGYRYGGVVPVLCPWSAKKLATNGVGRRWENSGPLGSPANYALYILAEYIRRETKEYPYSPSRFRMARGWLDETSLLRMCTSEPYRIGIVENPSYKADDKKLAIAPWVFTPQTPPPAG
ncbi:hypothetical protein TWF569_002911 [Orbilia oligospora]|nr:hypothetical protein TWF594_006242 [Orbilia oligospora]KAF3152604.1 hypothetical protein TWF569_002911 [Orbilia oligospora]